MMMTMAHSVRISCVALLLAMLMACDGDVEKQLRADYNAACESMGKVYFSDSMKNGKLILICADESTGALYTPFLRLRNLKP